MKKILVIEDEQQTRNIYLKCLSFEGYQAIGACQGQEGINLAKERTPDLVICDITMPDMDGYTVLSTLRKFQKTASIPFIFLTAKVSMEDLRLGMNLGADDYLTKPCKVDQFLTAIHSRLKRHRELATQDKVQQVQSIDSIESPTAPIQSHSVFPDIPHLNTVFQFIETHFREPIQIKEIANAAGYSPAYLTNLIKEQTGYSIKQWIIERRMESARILLSQTSSPIKTVAEASGYLDASYFTRQFRKIHNISPQKWREDSVSNTTELNRNNSV